ncbi:PaaI family thioesterase [Mycobacterium decipiens]|uniref:Acyl-coenzyme A thioesterase THEM4 n=1 Tax=Mycobacterium decipiens TaxID=1430326 RepID=A0A1X2LXD3_9MYCO|nr:PaaI family thioesterase [Mycobacterium decipiens]OSC41833.1 thioesterase [Mycobacterium decipiens]
MDATFEALSEAELGRVMASYAPLTEAVRDLIEATIRTQADDDVVRDATTAIEAVTRSLRSQRVRPLGVSYHVDGRPLPLGNAAAGQCNPIAPPLVVHHEEDGRCWSEFTLGVPYEGPPGLVHGGVCALVLDHMLGEAASQGLTKPLFTGTLTGRYLRGTPLGPIRAEAFVERIDGVKAFARGHLSDAAGVTVEAEGVFIKPAWARNVE